jgi:hypothetical protein
MRLDHGSDVTVL